MAKGILRIKLRILRLSRWVPNAITSGLFFFKILFIYFLDRGEGREREKKRNINVWVPLVHPSLGTWPATQACALTGNRTRKRLLYGRTPNQLSYRGQGGPLVFVYSCALLHYTVTPWSVQRLPYMRTLRCFPVLCNDRTVLQ